MKRTPLKRKTALKAKTRPKPKPRSSAEFQRVYGSKRRVEFVKHLVCSVCGATPCENAHTKSGGMGRKADYTTIIPLCRKCHRIQHAKGWQAFGFNAVDLERLAAFIQALWVRRDD